MLDGGKESGVDIMSSSLVERDECISHHCVMESIENPTVLEKVAHFNTLCSDASLYKSTINFIMF
jgi:hypothetical protein